MSTDASQPSGDELPPHLSSPEAFVRWWRENPEAVRQMTINARRIELGEFGELTPEMRRNVRRFLEARQQWSEVQAHNAAMLGEIAKVRKLLSETQCTLPLDHLLAHLADIEQRIERGDPIADEWQQFQLQFAAFQGEMMGSVERRAAMIAMSLDAHERLDPKRFADDANAQALLREWREGRMRERILGGLPIAERRELEALERKWRENPPGPAAR